MSVIEKLILGEVVVEERENNFNYMAWKKINLKTNDTAEEIRNKLELLQDDERLDKSAIKGLQEELDRILKIAESKTVIMGGGGVGKQNVYYYDLTNQLNGVTTVFNLPAFARILKVETFSGAVLRPLVDWTADANAYTLTFAIDAATYLATGQTCLVYYSI